MSAAEAYVGSGSVKLLNRVPEITIFFWIIKVMATTVGKTTAGFLATTLNLGLTSTSIVMSGLLILALWVQFRMRRYVPSVYWLVVVPVSVVGTSPEIGATRLIVCSLSRVSPGGPAPCLMHRRRVMDQAIAHVGRRSIAIPIIAYHVQPCPRNVIGSVATITPHYGGPTLWWP